MGSAQAATPASGTLSSTNRELTVTSGPHTVSNPTANSSGGTCNPPAQPCDHFDLTIASDVGPSDTVRIVASWPNPAEDFDFWLFKGSTIVDDAATGDNPEIMNAAAIPGNDYKIRIMPFAVAGGTATIKITLISPPLPPPDEDGDGVPDANDLCWGTPPGTTVGPDGCEAPPGDPGTCTVPGITLLTDAANDSTSRAPGTDLRSFQLAQPPQVPVGDRIEDQLLAFRINVSPGVTPSPSTAWFVSFISPGGVMGVRMTGDSSGSPVFQSYTVGLSNSGATDGRFVDSSRAAHSSSSLDAAAGQINIVVRAVDIGFTAPGQQMRDFNSGVTQTGGGLATAVDDGMPNNNLSRSTVSYALHDNRICGGPQLKPIGPPPPPSGLAPRFQLHPSPPGLADDAGEPSVGYNKFTKRTMFIALTQAVRQVYHENVVPQVLPASCDAIWEEKSGLLTTINTLDPILFTDEATGRTFNSQLSGANSLFEFTDDDGEFWMPAQQGPPNGGADHQTVASGPLPPAFTPPSAIWPENGPKRAVYYCSQSISNAFCARSDDGGQTFGPGFPFKNPECAAGALHGHVKVAPDGTVYVPDSSQCVLPTGESAERVVAFASEDAGATWAVRDVPSSTGGATSDPSVGIATDGTLYMCYESGDSTVHMAVSHDRGRTWINDQDIGRAAGIVQSRFPQSIAGDRERGACFFLGTTTPGAGGSLGFKGVWHGYIATTYDGGRTYHLVNVTPGDPVQGHGGVGTSGTNRNLLDFNDLQIDDQGRMIAAFADGCIGGCVKDPAANSFAAKGVIIRQTGGRTLYSKFDDISGTPDAVPRFNVTSLLPPLAACARQDLSRRTPVKADIVWNAPDDGGSPITNYKVYRATGASGPFTLLGESGPKQTFTDTTANPSIPKYYYRVEAENALGIAPVSNTIELEVDTEFTDTCSLPGEVISIDSIGDAPSDDMDIAYLAVAELEAFPTALAITMKIADFSADVPPSGSFYFMLFPLQGNKYIALDSTEGPARFDVGTYTVLPQGLLSFTPQRRLPDSSFAADGTIVFMVPKSEFGGLSPGSILSGFDARSRIGSRTATSRDTAGPGDYEVRGSEMCASITRFALASLNGSTVKGQAPLDVTFTLSGTPATGQALQTYSLFYGDEGSAGAPQTGSFGGMGSVERVHRYMQAGVWRARLTVTDTAGNVSTNLAEHTVEVLPGNLPPLARVTATTPIDEGDPGLLSGKNSQDPEGGALTYEWSQVSGRGAALTPAGDTASFVAPQVDQDEVLVFRLVVRDPQGAPSWPDDIQVTVRNLPGPVVPPQPPAPTLGENTHIGGAVPPLTVLVLALMGLARRRFANAALL